MLIVSNDVRERTSAISEGFVIFFLLTFRKIMGEEKLTEETLKAQEEEKERQRWLQVTPPSNHGIIGQIYRAKISRKVTLFEQNIVLYL